MAILSYILEDDRYLQSSGNKIWKLAEEQGICPGRGFWSLKERYRKTIVRNIFRYPIDREIAAKLIQFSRANAKGELNIGICYFILRPHQYYVFYIYVFSGKAKIRHKIQINSRLMYPDIELVEDEPTVW
ncbi:UNVERIFIED_CONTAM: hypothetical protein PYX00_004907 [Menopon gallinae]|uniref:Uncharacterized protein n=1 Tax=Menopon gallinae TaxID=328185 RepID=A0AAW2I6H0_9NEOP